VRVTPGSIRAALDAGALAACATSGPYLERTPGRPANLDDLWPCVRAAAHELESGQTALSSEEEKALGGRDVAGILY